MGLAQGQLHLRVHGSSNDDFARRKYSSDLALYYGQKRKRKIAVYSPTPLMQYIAQRDMYLSMYVLRVRENPFISGLAGKKNADRQNYTRSLPCQSGGQARTEREQSMADSYYY